MYVDLQGNQLRDITALADLPRLCDLNLNNNQIEDISALQTKKYLCVLYLRSNRLTVLPDLHALTNLGRCDLQGNRLTAEELQAKMPAALAQDYNWVRMNAYDPDRGDINGDGVVSISDVMELCKVLARIAAAQAPTEDEMEKGDLNIDQKITIEDIMEVCKILARQAA